MLCPQRVNYENVEILEYPYGKKFHHFWFPISHVKFAKIRTIQKYPSRWYLKRLDSFPEALFSMPVSQKIISYLILIHLKE